MARYRIQQPERQTRSVSHVVVWGLLLLVILLDILFLQTNNQLSLFNKNKPQVTAKSFDADQESQAAFQYLNRLREEVGVPPFSPSPILQQSAMQHARYLTRYLSDGHEEHQSHDPDFTGKTPQERAYHAGYHTQISENASLGKLAISGKEHINRLMTAIYHRFSLLSPTADEAGVAWAAGKYNALVVNQGSRLQQTICGRIQQEDAQKTPEELDLALRTFQLGSKAKKNQPASYAMLLECNGKMRSYVQDTPYDIARPEYIVFPVGQDVEPRYDGKEQPNPLAGTAWAEGVTGNPVSIELGTSSRITMQSFKIFSPNGEIWNTFILQNNNDPHHLLSRQQFALFPIKPLAWNTDYRVEFHYLENEQPKSVRWQFRTRKRSAR